jgi:hypothetical protein
MPRIAKIVNGGQTGADQGALEAALYCDFPYGGWIPKSRKSEKGMKNPVKYDQLREMDTGDYLARKEANVCDSNATLVFTYGPAIRETTTANGSTCLTTYPGPEPDCGAVCA